MKIIKGISLIILVIVIIVIVILVGTILLYLINHNAIENTKENAFKSAVLEYNSELMITASNEYIKNCLFDINTVNTSIWNGGETDGTVKQYILSITEADGQKFEIQNGKLVYVGTEPLEMKWIEDMGMVVGTVLPPNQ